MRVLVRSSVALALLLGLAVTAHAQQQKTFGIIAGVNWSTFNGTDADQPYDLFPPGATSTTLERTFLTGFIGGLYATIPISDQVAFEPELLYAGKGSRYDYTFTSATSSLAATLDFDLHYLSIPLLARYDYRPDGGPYGLLGVSVNFNVGCSIKASGTLADSVGAPSSTDCGSAAAFYGADLSANTTISGVVGLGYEMGKFGLEGRYDYDFGDAFKDDLSLHNTTWEVMLRYRFR